MRAFWDERYAADEFAYGIHPNRFFQSSVESLSPGRALFPAEGEGRNAVYAASLGWECHAFDFSSSAKEKAEAFAKKTGLLIDYRCCSFEEYQGDAAGYDLVVLVFAHMPPVLRPLLHQRVIEWLKPGGTLILEGFTPEQLGYTSGGPKDEAMLFTEAMLRDDFAGLEIRTIEKTITVLDEGPFHQGEASVIRMIAAKKGAK